MPVSQVIRPGTKGVTSRSSWGSTRTEKPCWPLASGLNFGMPWLTGAAVGAGVTGAKGMLTGALSTDIRTILTNVSQRRPWYQNLASSSLRGAATGGAGGAGKSLGSSAWAGTQNLATRAAGKGIISDSTAFKVVTLPELAKSMATSDQAYATYAVAGCFLAAGYAAWGMETLSRAQSRS